MPAWKALAATLALGLAPLTGRAGADVAVLDISGPVPGGSVTVSVHDDFLGLEYCGGTCFAPAACGVQVNLPSGASASAAASAVAAAINANGACQTSAVTAVSDPGSPGRVILSWTLAEYNVCVDGWLMRDRNGSCEMTLATSCGTFVCTETAERPYCTAGFSASSCAVTPFTQGAASAAASSGFRIEAAGVEGGSDGLFFFGTSGRQARPWGNGSSLQCVKPPVKRTTLVAGNGAPGFCAGLHSLDLNALWCSTCPRPGINPGAGAAVYAQLWYRDPLSTSNRASSLSSALQFYVGP